MSDSQSFPTEPSRIPTLVTRSFHSSSRNLAREHSLQNSHSCAIAAETAPVHNLQNEIKATTTEMDKKSPPTFTSTNPYVGLVPPVNRRSNTVMSFHDTPGSRFFRRQNTLSSYQLDLTNGHPQRHNLDRIPNALVNPTLRGLNHSNCTTPAMSGRNSPAFSQDFGRPLDGVKSDFKINLMNPSPNLTSFREVKQRSISNNYTPEYDSQRSSPVPSNDPYSRQTAMMDKLQQQLDEKQEQYLKLKEEQVTSAMKVNCLQEQLGSIKEKYKTLKSNSKSMKDTIFNHSHELTEAKNAKDKVEAKMEKLEQDLQVNQFQLDKMKKELEEKDSLLQKHRECDVEKERLALCAEQLKARLATAQETSVRMEKEKQRLSETVTDLETENELLKSAHAKLKQAYQRVRGESQDELDEMRATSQRKIRELQEQADDASKENDHLQRKIMDYERKLANLSNTRSQIPAEEGLFQQNPKREDECKLLKIRLHNLQSEYDAYRLENDGEYLKRKIAELKSENERLTQNQLNLEQNMQTQAFSDSKYKFTLRELEGRCHALEKEKSQLQTKLSSRSSEMNKLLGQIDKFTQQLEQTQTQMLAKNKELEKMEDENARLSRELAETRAKLLELEESRDGDMEALSRLRHADDEMEKLRKHLDAITADKDAEISQLQVELNQCNAELEELQKEVEAARENERSGKSDSRKLRRQLTEYEEELAVLKKRLEAAREEQEAAEEMARKRDLERQLSYGVESNLANISPVSLDDDLRDRNDSKDRLDRNIYSTIPRRPRNLGKSQSQSQQEDLLSQADAALNARGSNRIRSPLTHSTFTRTASTQDQ